jgi:hypothetical protein
MAQDVLTVTPPNPSPPTNISCTGASGPNPGTFDPLIYLDPKNWGTGTPTNAPPYFDDGITRTLTSGGINENIPASGVSASPQAIAVKVAALAVAGTSVDGEGRGTENVVTASVANPSPAGQLKTVNCGPNATQATRDAGPNASHAATQSPTTFPTLTSTTPSTSTAGTTTQGITLTGTGFVPGCRIYINGMMVSTTYVSATSLSTTVPKKPTAGGTPWEIKVGLGGGFTAPQSFTWT